MGCCGNKTVTQAKNIAIGYANLTRDKKYEFTDSRIRECHKCQFQTWLTWAEYTRWLAEHGLEILINFSQLEKLPRLPEQKQDAKRKNLFCKLCKCYVPAAARVKDKKCPKGRW